MKKYVMLLISSLINFCYASTDMVMKNNIEKYYYEYRGVHCPEYCRQYPTSEKVAFSIKAKKKYEQGRAINIELVWKNNSDKDEIILIFPYGEGMIGLGAVVIDENNSIINTASINSYISLSSKVFNKDELAYKEVILKPNEIKKQTFDLMKIPEFDYKLSELGLEKGKYQFQVFYFDKKSEMLEFEITKPQDPLFLESKKNSFENHKVFREKHNFFVFPSSKEVEFSINAKKKYKQGKVIDIDLVWKNNSDENETILIYDYKNSLIGLGALVFNDKNEVITEKPSKLFYSSKFFTADEILDRKVILKPNETKKYTINLMEVPFFQNNNLKKKGLEKGQYKVQLLYYDRKSKILEIEIE
ncbi:hypothetical protein [Phocoenobacter skyensis]|uniref:Uncharacterized protein n=1 Tax=Phocoenobacter skyensis TaxID=97481 RepID=A0A1H7YDB5_9PAST|nr:hypothetical protein [Pasteurella skyensis]MDP8079716.1 hypothetical protein [Pasteurella skyensis]MDP8085709.1 hypothetical protein [Pasteurella skyensis]MDP8185478.1 hypothetical protein [Pasteurella skyensis]QLB22310.1 hypothetical protein A6B44_03480 [Pasteurella skyensis]SEM43891.1 hypothetical protein SAMN05444853_1185 [Pasteurella skyensis]